LVILIRNQTQILKNEITNNKLNGVECIGENNITIIKDNPLISFNKNAGIKAD